MVTSVSSYDEVDEFMYPLGGGDYQVIVLRFPDGSFLDKLSALVKTNRLSYLSQQRGAVCDSRQTGSLHFDRAALRATWS